MISASYPRYNPETGQIDMIDSSSNQAIPGYNIVPSWQQVNLKDYGLGLNDTPTDENKSPIDAPTTKDIYKEDDQTEKEKINARVERGGGDTVGNFSGSGKRDASNNYSYFDKPTGMGFISSLPGPLGIVGKGVNAVVNANNVGAVNAARADLGLDKLGFGDSLKGTINDRQGFVANVDYTDKFGTVQNMPVSLEAVQNKSLSPDIITGLPGTVALSQDQKNPDKRGLFSGLKDITRSVIGSLFGEDKSAQTQTVSSKAFGDMTVASPKTGGIYDQFPDAPSGTSQSNHSKERERNDWSGFSSGGGLSDAARDAVDKGTGGLY